MVFILYNIGVQLKKLSPRPVNVGLRQVLDENTLFVRVIKVSKKGKVLFISVSMDDSTCSSIIYLFTCGECNSQYVGSSIRQLKCRVAEHMGLSPRSNLPISHPNFSSILEHHKLSKHALSPSNFKILSNSNNSDIRLLESIYIYKLRPKLNNSTPCELNIV